MTNTLGVVNMKDKCPICNGELFENEYGDIQCSNCRKVIPFDTHRVKKEGDTNDS